ncbi:MAG: ABC transporter ATP-binding protein/permease, partial [Actinomycetota bacterium]|nr:ABC transporter ATP-binding protein/permease [Actinomycetota bacterium]
ILAGVETAFPAVLGRTVDAVLGGHDPMPWLVGCGLLVGLLIVSGALNDLANGMGTARATASLRRSVLDHVLAQGMHSTRRFPVGDITTRMVGNAADAGRAGTVLVWVVAALVPALGGIVALALIDPLLCLTFFAGAPLLVVMVRSNVRNAAELAERYLQAQGRIATRLVDALTGARSIAAAQTTARERRRVLAPLPELHSAGMGMWRVQTRLAAQQALLIPVLQVAVLAIAGIELGRGRISPGEVLAATQYVGLAAGIGSAVASVTRFARVRAAAGRTAEVLAEPAAQYGAAPLPEGRGQVEFRAVTVRERGIPVLQDLDLVVPAGALVAVVGCSGSGKSLLAALAGRLVDPDEGQVLLDGVPLPELARRELRRAVGYGFERPALIGDTLADVIALGGHIPDQLDVAAAARAACADGFIRRMPQGYRTRLADARMSGGEMQRIGLARAFVRTARVLVLDDVAASLDTVTEHHIRQVLTGALADRTRLVVAHRASTAAHADLVAWLDDGRVRYLAPHHELWKQPGYREVFDEGLSSGGPDDRKPA